MQIHAGIYKGRRIKTVKNAPYRPTAAVVRKSLFDILGIIENKSFLTSKTISCINLLSFDFEICHMILTLL